MKTILFLVWQELKCFTFAIILPIISMVKLRLLYQETKCAQILRNTSYHTDNGLMHEKKYNLEIRGV